MLQDKAIQIKNTLAKVPGFTDLTVVRELGQPSLLIDVDRDKIARYGINVADVEAVISAAVGGQAATQVIQGEKLFDLVVRMQPQFRSSAHEIGELLVGTPDGKQIPLSQLANITAGQWRIVHLSREQLALHRRAVQHRRARPGACRARRPEGGRPGRCAAARLLAELGRRVQPVSGSQVAAHADRSARRRPHLHDPVRAIRKLQVPGHDCAGRDS